MTADAAKEISETAAKQVIEKMTEVLKANFAKTYGADIAE